MQVSAPEQESKETTFWEPAGGEEWLPKTDVIEKKDEFIVTTELPGVELDNVDVSAADNMLTIRGEKKSEHEVKKEDYYLSEREFGTFYRSVELPPGTDASRIKAAFSDGVLTVIVTKTVESAQARVKVPIKTTIEANRS